MTEPIYCPLGAADGCVIQDGAGTCEAVKYGSVGKTSRVCRGWAAVVCDRAFERWEADGRRAGGAPLEHSPRPAAPAMDPSDRWMDPAISTVPGNFEAWEIYGATPEECTRQRDVRDHV